MYKDNARPMRSYAQWLMTVGVWGICVFIIILLKILFGNRFDASLLLFLPVLLFSRSLGMWRSIFITAAGLIVSILLQIFLNIDTFENMLISGYTILVPSILFVSILLGRIGEKRSAGKEDGDIDNTTGLQTEQMEFVSLLNEIVSTSLESIDMAGMLNNLVSRLVELFSADMCMITSWNEEDEQASPMAAFGSEAEVLLSGSLDHGLKKLTSLVLDSGHSQILDETEVFSYLDPYKGIKSIQALPLISEGKKLGVLILGFYTSDQFSEQDVKWGELYAPYVSLAISRVMLLEETNSRVRELSGLHRISQVLNYPEISRNTYGQLTEILADLLGAEICMVGLIETETNEVIIKAAAFGLEDEQIQSYRFTMDCEEMTRELAEKNAYYSNSPKSINPAYGNITQLLSVDSFMVVPLKRKNQSLFGFVFLLNKLHGFNEDDLQLIEVLSDQVSFVIQNMLLFSSERRRNEELSVLNDISIAAADAQNEDDLIEFVTQLIGKKLFPDNFGVMMLDDTGEIMVLHSSYRLGDYEIPASIPLSQGVSGYVARTGKVRREKDIRIVDDYLMVDNHTLSELCIPIKVNDEVIGVFNTESTRLNAFSKRDEDLLKIITSQLSIVIERLRSDKAQKRQTSALARSNAFIKVLAQVSSKATKAVIPDGVIQTLGNELVAIGLFCVIALPRVEDHKMHIVFTSIPERIVRVIERASRKKLGEYSFSLDHVWQQPLRSMEPVLLSGPANVLSNYLVEVSRDTIQRILAPTGVTSSMPICQIPLVLEGTIQGFIWLWGKDLQSSDIPAMSIFGSQVAISLQNASLMEEVHKMAEMDDLTGIFNRRYFFELAEREFNQARKYELPLSAMIIDIDHFKKVNDTFGHIVGDQVLRNTAKVLRKNLRDQDTLGRYGGEEFSIIMPVTDEEAAHQLALRLRSKVSESRVDTDAGSVSVNISLGVSQLNEDMPTLLSLIHQADKAMYIAKSTGGNSVGRI